MNRFLKIIKNIVVYALIFAAAQALFLLFLIGVSKIPQDSVRENMCESADYLCEKPVFFHGAESVEDSWIDRYADSITLNIAWNLGEGDTLTSVMLTEWNTSEYYDENTCFYATVNGMDYEGSEITQYLRYWHGSAAMIRFMHLFFNLKQIYIFNGILMGALALVLIFLFVKRKLWDCIIALAAGLAATSVWFVPMSLEYTWVYIITLAVMIAVVLLSKKDIKFSIGAVFVGAMLINYFDFLSAETLSLTVPLLLMMRLHFGERKSKNISSKAKIFTAVKCAIAWGAGYVLTWLCKWGMAAVILKENVMPYVSEHVAERLGAGDNSGIDESSPVLFVLHALIRNIKSLFPLGYGILGVVATIILVIVAAYIVFVYRKKGADRTYILICLAIGLVPYIRYMVLLNHSYLHYFFTYRAQMATLMAVVLIISEIIGYRLKGRK